MISFHFRRNLHCKMSPDNQLTSLSLKTNKQLSTCSSLLVDLYYVGLPHLPLYLITFFQGQNHISLIKHKQKVTYSILNGSCVYTLSKKQFLFNIKLVTRSPIVVGQSRFWECCARLHKNWSEVKLLVTNEHFTMSNRQKFSA